MAQKGGIKLRRSSKHANKYKAQFIRTERNKHNQSARMARRKAKWSSTAKADSNTAVSE